MSFAEDVKGEENIFPADDDLDASLTETGTAHGEEEARDGPFSRTAPAGSLGDTTSPKKGKPLSKTMGADPETLSRLKQMQLEEDDDDMGQTAPVGKGRLCTAVLFVYRLSPPPSTMVCRIIFSKGAVSRLGDFSEKHAAKSKGGDAMYSDEEDGIGMTKEELQSKAASRCVGVRVWARVLSLFVLARVLTKRGMQARTRCVCCETSSQARTHSHTCPRQGG